MSTRFSFGNMDVNEDKSSAKYRQDSTYNTPTVKPLSKKNTFWKRFFQCIFW